MGLKRVSVIGFCLAAVAAVVMLAAVIIRPPKIYISEICPSNSETSKKTAMQDKNGEPSDWIEIYNPTNKDISLTGFSLSKNGGVDQPLGGYVIKAHDYIIVYCSSAGFENADFPHADFIRLPKLNQGVSYSKNVKGEMYVSEPTPLAANAEKTIGDTPVFSQAAGSYEKAFDLEITAGESQTVYYTTDGTDPATSDTRKVYENALRIDDRSDDENVLSAYDPMKIQLDYRDSIKLPDKSAVDKGTVIRACAEGTSGKCGKTVTATYFVDVSSADHNDLPIVSITTDPDGLFNEKTGIYCLGDVYKEYDEENLDHPWNGSIPANYNQRGREWEKECYVEYFDSEGNSLISQDCGIRIQGNYSRSDLQKGFRLYARKKYGEKKFKYEVFEGLKNASDETIDSFKTLTLRAGGNCAFTAKFNDTYWQSLMKELDGSTKASRPCVVYLNGEYWGLYVLEEDYSDNYFESHYGVNKDDVVVYKGDAETYQSGYKLDEGKLPEGETDEGYFFKELTDFFASHKDLSAQADYEEFSKLVDTDSVRDYFLAEVWINNKWDWPGKNWSMWKVQNTDSSKKYADGKWRFMFYDVEFGGVSGEGDAWTNTMKEDNYKPKGLLDTDTKNPAVLSFAYLMSNEDFRNDFNDRLLKMSEGTFEKEKALDRLAEFESIYSPLYEQFFARYPETGSAEEALHGGYASSDCIRAFINKRDKSIQSIVDWTNSQF